MGYFPLWYLTHIYLLIFKINFSKHSFINLVIILTGKKLRKPQKLFLTAEAFFV